MKSAKAEVNGVQLYYDMIGNGRHVVVLLPGVLGKRPIGGCNNNNIFVFAVKPL